MATRDRSARIGFSNTNVYYLYQKAKVAAETAKTQPIQSTAPVQKREATHEETLHAWELKSRVLRPEALKEAKIETFSPQKLQSSEDTSIQSLENLKSNLDRLQELHSKLRFMLKELEHMVGNKK